MAFSDFIFTVIYIPRVVKWLVHGSAGFILCHILLFLITIVVCNKRRTFSGRDVSVAHILFDKTLRVRYLRDVVDRDKREDPDYFCDGLG